MMTYIIYNDKYNASLDPYWQGNKLSSTISISAIKGDLCLILQRIMFPLEYWKHDFELSKQDEVGMSRLVDKPEIN